MSQSNQNDSNSSSHNDNPIQSSSSSSSSSNNNENNNTDQLNQPGPSRMNHPFFQPIYIPFGPFGPTSVPTPLPPSSTNGTYGSDTTESNSSNQVSETQNMSSNNGERSNDESSDEPELSISFEFFSGPIPNFDGNQNEPPHNDNIHQPSNTHTTNMNRPEMNSNNPEQNQTPTPSHMNIPFIPSNFGLNSPNSTNIFPSPSHPFIPFGFNHHSPTHHTQETLTPRPRSAPPLSPVTHPGPGMNFGQSTGLGPGQGSGQSGPTRQTGSEIPGNTDNGIPPNHPGRIFFFGGPSMQPIPPFPPGPGVGPLPHQVGLNGHPMPIPQDQPLPPNATGSSAQSQGQSQGQPQGQPPGLGPGPGLPPNFPAELAPFFNIMMPFLPGMTFGPTQAQPDPEKAAELLRSLPSVGQALLRRVNKIVAAEEAEVHHHDDDDDEEDEEEEKGWKCGVCLEGISEETKEDTGVKALPCNHLFHGDCLKPWFATNHTCPTCRLDLDPLQTLRSPEDDSSRPRQTGSGRQTPSGPYTRAQSRPHRVSVNNPSADLGNTAGIQNDSTAPSSRVGTPPINASERSFTFIWGPRPPPPFNGTPPRLRSRQQTPGPNAASSGDAPQSETSGRSETSQANHLSHHAGPNGSQTPGQAQSSPVPAPMERFSSPVPGPIPGAGVQLNNMNASDVHTHSNNSSPSRNPGQARTTNEGSRRIHVFRSPHVGGGLAPDQGPSADQRPTSTGSISFIFSELPHPTGADAEAQIPGLREQRLREEAKKRQKPFVAQSLESWTQEKERALGWRCEAPECLIAPPIPASSTHYPSTPVSEQFETFDNSMFSEEDKQMLSINSPLQALVKSPSATSGQQFEIHACAHRWHRACLRANELAAGRWNGGEREDGRVWVRCGRCRKDGWVVSESTAEV